MVDFHRTTEEQGAISLNRAVLLYLLYRTINIKLRDKVPDQ